MRANKPSKYNYSFDFRRLKFEGCGTESNNRTILVLLMIFLVVLVVLLSVSFYLIAETTKFETLFSILGLNQIFAQTKKILSR